MESTKVVLIKVKLSVIMEFIIEAVPVKNKVKATCKLTWYKISDNLLAQQNETCTMSVQKMLRKILEWCLFF